MKEGNSPQRQHRQYCLMFANTQQAVVHYDQGMHQQFFHHCVTEIEFSNNQGKQAKIWKTRLKINIRILIKLGELFEKGKFVFYNNTSYESKNLQKVKRFSSQINVLDFIYCVSLIYPSRFHFTNELLTLIILPPEIQIQQIPRAISSPRKGLNLS